MAILASELKTYKSAVEGTGGTNGGRIDDSELITTAVAGRIPSISPSQLSAGVTLYFKNHMRVENADALTFSDAGVVMILPVTSDGEGYIFAGTQTDTQADISSPDLCGCGQLDANVSASATEIDVAVDDGTVIIFRDGERIWIGDGTNEELVVIDGTPSVAGDVVTITLATGLVNSYTASNTYVGSVVDAAADIEGSISNASDTSASGTLDDTQIVPGPIGAIYANVTITMTAANTFTAADDNGNDLGSGSTLSAFAPTNPNTSTPFFTIPSAAWGGTRIAAETFSFRVNPPTLPYWMQLLYPSSSTAGSGVTFKVKYVGYSA